MLSCPRLPRLSWLHVWTFDDDVYYYIRWRLKLEGETENTGVCTKERRESPTSIVVEINLAPASLALKERMHAGPLAPRAGRPLCVLFEVSLCCA